ncbi:MAG: hypothetical protein KatS3mg111_2024 [Pirellulaceae bacterium]|nr:MAG: hypothetical protein KatS3mg111_2024 [Pirellulaceae bacterium]
MGVRTKKEAMPLGPPTRSRPAAEPPITVSARIYPKSSNVIDLHCPFATPIDSGRGPSVSASNREHEVNRPTDTRQPMVALKTEA